jgi:hypothetical protein
VRDWWSARRMKEEVSGGVWRGSIAFVFAFVGLVEGGVVWLEVIGEVGGGSIGGSLIFLPEELWRSCDMAEGLPVVAGSWG